MGHMWFLPEENVDDDRGCGRLLSLTTLLEYRSSFNILLTVFLKMRFQPSKGMSNGSHCTSTDVSRTDLNLSPSGSGRSGGI